MNDGQTHRNFHDFIKYLTASAGENISLSTEIWTRNRLQEKEKIEKEFFAINERDACQMFCFH